MHENWDPVNQWESQKYIIPGWEFNKIQYQKLITFNRNHKFPFLVFLVISYKLTEKKF